MENEQKSKWSHHHQVVNKKDSVRRKKSKDRFLFIHLPVFTSWRERDVHSVDLIPILLSLTFPQISTDGMLIVLLVMETIPLKSFLGVGKKKKNEAHSPIYCTEGRLTLNLII